MADETYNGYANRETWAFNLHWQNDEGLYNAVLDNAREAMRQTEYDADTWTDDALGRNAVDFFSDLLRESDAHAWEHVVSVLSDIGSFWRIDYAEVGSAVRESLDAES